MKTQTLNKVLVLSLATVAILGSVACSSQQGASLANNGVYAAGLAGTAGYDALGRALTNCSHDVAGIPDLSISVENYTMSGQLYNNWIRVRFNAFPANFTNPNALITFWAYGTDGANNYGAMTQVPFFVESNNGSGAYSQISQPTYSLTWSQLASYAATAGSGTSSGAAAVATMTFVVQLDIAPTSTIIEPALYLNGAGTGGYYTSADRFIQALIPTFLANPLDYATSHDQVSLSLHPFYNLISSGYSESQYESLGQGLCF